MKPLIDYFFNRYFFKPSKIMKQFKIGWKTKILVMFSCFQVHLLKLSLNTSRPIKKEGVKISITEYAAFVQYEQTY
jgi:hypothetical protein